MRPFRAIAVLILLAAAGYAGAFYYKNLRGALPALKEPSQDIVKLFVNALQPPLTVRGGAGELPLTLPSEFSISVFAKDLLKPRVVIIDPAGYLLVSIPSQGKIVALVGEVGSSLAGSPRQITLLEGLNRPHGMAIACTGESSEKKAPCELLVAETDRISAYEYWYDSSKTPEVPHARYKKTIVTLPKGGNHFTRTLAFGPDGKLYVSIGSSCNACNEKDPRRAAIYSMNPDGSDFKEYARGLRNAVFMAVHPVTGELWATEMGRDLLGDDLPPDEINIVEEGKDYGWPYCYGKNVQDPFGKERRVACDDKTPSHIDIPAHSAPLGLAFVPPDPSWPKEYWYNLLVAYHGSWNRSVPTGYKIVRYKLDQDGNYLGEEDFITGWITDGGEVLGRPVDILIQPNGVMYISDDKAGVIYQVKYD